VSYDYRVLTDADRGRLRMERVRALEAEICRAELALDDALSDAERDSIYADIEVIRQRLIPHYVALGLDTGGAAADAEEGAGEPAGDGLRPAG